MQWVNKLTTMLCSAFISKGKWAKNSLLYFLKCFSHQCVQSNKNWDTGKYDDQWHIVLRNSSFYCPHDVRLFYSIHAKNFFFDLDLPCSFWLTGSAKSWIIFYADFGTKISIKSNSYPIEFYCSQENAHKSWTFY